MTIPTQRIEPSNGIIPEKVAEFSQKEESPELEPVLISFARYNSSECDLNNGIDNKRARKALQAIRDIGVEICAEDDFGCKLPNLEIIPIANQDDYRKLYKGLADLPDAVVQEAKIDKDKGRIFFLFIKRIFYIIAIGDSHYETDKQRR
jgi:hypothetical protein